MKPTQTLYTVAHKISPTVRAERNGHRGIVVWLTGLSASGKSTLAMRAEQWLFEAGRQVYVLDGDNVRRGLSSDLAFLPQDRSENIRRVGEVAALFADAGVVVITAFISPYSVDRARARKATADNFCEVYVKAPLVLCEERDPKGLYRKARAGLIPDFTAVSAPYELPETPELVIDTSTENEDESARRLVAFIEERIRV
jgi:bifunctional enzyme CysN/CysC